MFKRTLKYYKQENFSKILSEIHSSMENKINNIKEENKAQQIEQILKEIKQTVRMLREKNIENDSPIEGYMSRELAELLVETFSILNQSHPGLNKNVKLFQRQHNEVIVDKKIADDIFEEQLAALIVAASKIKKTNTSIELVLGGTNQVTSQNLNKITDNIEKSIIKMTNEAINYQVSKYNKKISKNVKIEAKAGKTDIFAPKIELKEDANDLVSRFLKAISGATFTLKNYTSKKLNIDEQTKEIIGISTKNLEDINIHLGNTNYYKAITGALSDIVLDSRAQRRIFFRGMEILSGKSEEPDTATEQEVNTHFGHLRFIYQLKGTGLIDATIGKNVAADYIIWNDPNSDNIIVRSTNELIKKYWKNYTNAFSAISIRASQL